MSEIREYCGDCDGCGWYEGGAAIMTTCKTCNGTGIITRQVANPPRPLTPAAIDVDELEQLWEASTPETWIHWNGGTENEVRAEELRTPIVHWAGFDDCNRSHEGHAANAAFIAAAHNQMPALLARIRKLQEWQENVSKAVRGLPAFQWPWEGDRNGWGFHWEVIRAAANELDTARQSIQRLREALKRSRRSIIEGHAYYWTDAEIDAVEAGERGGE